MTWEAAWQAGRTGWDAGQAAPALLELLALDSPKSPGTLGVSGAQRGQVEAPCRFDALVAGSAEAATSQPPMRVLVPGAGAGYDVLALAAPHRAVLGLDLAPSAKARFDALLEQHPRPAHAPLDVSYWVTDFFSLSADPRWSGPADAAWDYTFFCALNPTQRPAWARAMAQLIRPAGALFTLMFPLIEDPTLGAALDESASPVDRDQGPPFPLTQAIYAEHLLAPGADGAPLFRLEARWPVERSHPGRAGKEALAVWRRSS